MTTLFEIVAFPIIIAGIGISILYWKRSRLRKQLHEQIVKNYRNQVFEALIVRGLPEEEARYYADSLSEDCFEFYER